MAIKRNLSPSAPQTAPTAALAFSQVSSAFVLSPLLSPARSPRSSFSADAARSTDGSDMVSSPSSEAPSLLPTSPMPLFTSQLSPSSLVSSVQDPIASVNTGTSNTQVHRHTLIGAIIGAVVGGTIVLLAVVILWRHRTFRQIDQAHDVQPFVSWRIGRSVSAIDSKPPEIASNPDVDSTIAISVSSSRIAEGSHKSLAEHLHSELALQDSRQVESVLAAIPGRGKAPRRDLSETRDRSPPPPPLPPPTPLPPPPSSPPPLAPPQPLPSLPPTLQHQDSGLRLMSTYLKEIPPAYSRD